MKRFKNILASALAALSFFAVSCDRNDMTEPQVEYLDVNANNISGQVGSSQIRLFAGIAM